MVRKLDEGLFYSAPGTEHYNIKFKSGLLLTRVTARSFEGLAPKSIEWAWIVEEKRYANVDELKSLCAPTNAS